MHALQVLFYLSLVLSYLNLTVSYFSSPFPCSFDHDMQHCGSFDLHPVLPTNLSRHEICILFFLHFVAWGVGGGVGDLNF